MNFIRNSISSKGVRFIGGGWTFFILENLVLSEYREEIISQYGDDNYHTVYNSLSTAACCSIFYGFIKYRKHGIIMPKPNTPLLLFGFVCQVTFRGSSLIFPPASSPFYSLNF